MLWKFLCEIAEPIGDTTSSLFLCYWKNDLFFKKMEGTQEGTYKKIGQCFQYTMNSAFLSQNS